MDSNTTKISDEARNYAKIFVDGLNEAVTPFHVVDYIKNQLLSNGFTELREK